MSDSVATKDLPADGLSADALERVRRAIRETPLASRSIAGIASLTLLSESQVRDALLRLYREMPPVDVDELPPITRSLLGIAAGLPDRPYKDLVAEAIEEKYGRQS